MDRRREGQTKNFMPLVLAFASMKAQKRLGQERKEKDNKMHCSVRRL